MKQLKMIRTGKGDEGNTSIGGKTYRKGHKLIQFIGALDRCQSLSVAIPVKWGEYKPRAIIQQILYTIASAVHARQPRDFELRINELGTYIEAQIDSIVAGIELKNFLVPVESSAKLHELRCAIREAECKCVEARDYLEIEDASLSANMIYILEQIAKLLNILSDWVFAFVVVYSDLSETFSLWPEEKVRTLNL